MPLEAFFDAMSPFLAGTLDASAVEARLGACPSGTARLALYRELVRRQHRDVLDGLFVSVRHACASLRAGLWGELVDGYLRAHPPTHWEPNHAGIALSDYLARLREHDGSLPVLLEELADYEMSRFLVGVRGLTDDDGGPALDRDMFLRHYDHDVAAYADQARRAAAPPWPERRPTTLLLAWSRTEERVVALHVSLAAVAVVARRAGRPLSSRLDPLSLADAERTLARLGILSATPTKEEDVPR